MLTFKAFCEANLGGLITRPKTLSARVRQALAQQRKADKPVQPLHLSSKKKPRPALS